MSNEQVIRDLNTLRDYFMEESGGCVPVCIEEAIRIISELKEDK